MGKQNNGDFTFWGAFHRQGERQRPEGVKVRTSCKRCSSLLPRLFPVSPASRLLPQALAITQYSAGLTLCFVRPKGELVSAFEMLSLSQRPPHDNICFTAQDFGPVPQAGQQPSEVGDLKWCQGQRLVMGKGQRKSIGSRGQMCLERLPLGCLPKGSCPMVWNNLPVASQNWTRERSCCSSIAGKYNLQRESFV